MRGDGRRSESMNPHPGPLPVSGEGDTDELIEISTSYGFAVPAAQGVVLRGLPEGSVLVLSDG